MFRIIFSNWKSLWEQIKSNPMNHTSLETFKFNTKPKRTKEFPSYLRDTTQSSHFLRNTFFRHNLSKTVNALLFAWKLDFRRETIIKTIEKRFFEIKIVWLIHPLKAKKSLLLHRLLSIFSVLVHVACFNNHFFFCFIFNCLCFSWVLWIMKVKKTQICIFNVTVCLFA